MKRKMSGALLASFLFAIAGCGRSGPALGYVEGTVTMDGAPLSKARVEFRLQGPGRSSIGYTDEHGCYVLAFTRDRKGALLGDHVVDISTRNNGNPDEGVAPSPETVPVQFNVRSELVRTVKSGSNQFDFALTSEGKIDNSAER